MEKLSLSYYMAQTTVTINGTVTTHYDHRGRADTFDRTSIVSIGVGADPSTAQQVEVENRRFHHADTELDLHFGPDGRLAGAGFQSSGVGAEVIGAVVCMTSLAASVASGIGALASLARSQKQAGELVADPAGAQTEWEALNQRAEQLKTLVSDLQKRAIESAGKAVGEGPVPTGLADELKAVSAALDLARAEAAKVKQALGSWQVKHFPDATTAFTFVLGIDELPAAGSVEDSFELDPDQLTGKAKEAAHQLQTLVRRVDTPQATRPAVPHPDPDAIVYRAPYQTTLAVYELTAGDGGDAALQAKGPRNWELRQVVPIWAVGAQSEVRSATMLTDHFGKNSIHLEFGDSGALSHLTVAETGALANISSTISGVLGTGGGTSAASAAGDGSASKPPVTAPDPVLAPLQAEAAQKQLEASIATANKTIRDSQQ
jgi:hypothetical protein